ncbi:MAG TPA: L-aspartate oxidase [Streptosporangiaceae bacterium]|nr:L-aspartate oxidase [Streptosporangiaceae bacterium]
MSELRGLPLPGPQWERAADVVVVGSGAAGISAALAASAHGRRVLLVVKGGLAGGATPLAQGGLAAALGPGDSPALHQRDTLVAGAGLGDPRAVAMLVSQAPAAVRRLRGLGARLESDSLHLEGGHSRRRIVSAGGDAIGAEVHRVLTAALLASPVEVLTGAVALDALVGDAGEVRGLLVGLVCNDGQALRVGMVTARGVVLATGGFGQAYATTTSPRGGTGDGLALAARAGANLCDVEFVQFHPTVLWRPGARGQCPLVTEALRGAGAVLVDVAGSPVMAGRHPLGDLAPRDVVSAAMQERMEAGDGPGDHLWLDATGLGRQVERGFPTVTARCREAGIDPVTEPIPVAPGAHYTCGGVRADLDGRTSVPGLYAVGEVASTGVHGANRLASNSVTEALIAGQRVGDLLGQALAPARPGLRAVGPDSHITTTGLRPPPVGDGVAAAFRPELASAMSRHAGVLRDGAGLARLLDLLARAPATAALDLASVEATNLHTVATLVGVAALARMESRGCHRRRDARGNAAHAGQHTLLRWHGERLSVSPVAIPGSGQARAGDGTGQAWAAAGAGA